MWFARCTCTYDIGRSKNHGFTRSHGDFAGFDGSNGVYAVPSYARYARFDVDRNMKPRLIEKVSGIFFFFNITFRYCIIICTIASAIRLILDVVLKKEKKKKKKIVILKTRIIEKQPTSEKKPRQT